MILVVGKHSRLIQKPRNGNGIWKILGRKQHFMKLSRETRRIVRRCIEDATYQLDQLDKGFLKLADATRLDTIRMLLARIATRLEDTKHGRRGHDRGV